MITLLLVILAIIVTFVVTIVASSQIWKCCPCTDGVPDCTERDRAVAAVKKRQKGLAS